MDEYYFISFHFMKWKNNRKQSRVACSQLVLYEYVRGNNREMILFKMEINNTKAISYHDEAMNSEQRVTRNVFYTGPVAATIRLQAILVQLEALERQQARGASYQREEATVGQLPQATAASPRTRTGVEE